MLCRMRRWILGGAGVVVGVLLLVVIVALRFPTVNGDTGRPPKLFHEPYTGIEFRYPATWQDVKGAHGIADFKGAHGCEIAVNGGVGATDPIATEMESLRKDMSDQPKREFSPRPAWAGSRVPDASFGMTTDRAAGVMETEWETGFQHADDQVIVSETMHEGDGGCRSDLLAFERSFRLFPADPNAK